MNLIQNKDKEGCERHGGAKPFYRSMQAKPWNIFVLDDVF